MLTCAALRFQSLLFWIIGSGWRYRAAANQRRSFNPCCFGSLVRATLFVYHISPPIVWFQSLLFWIIGSGLVRMQCIGLLRRVSILVVLDHWFGPANVACPKRLFAFQSLLFWIIGSGLAIDGKSSVAVAEFQSLLFWIIGSGLPQEADNHAQPRFQSLLFWIIGSGWNPSNRVTLHELVSILVVLDHWFGPEKLQLTTNLTTVSFNPCCFGSLVRA